MTVVINCRVQPEDFVVDQEYQALRRQDCGAVVLFCGLVREQFQPLERSQGMPQPTDTLQALELEHYPDMTEHSIRAIAGQAAKRFDLRAITVVHRIGLLPLGAQIVLVGVAAPHRSDAFAACDMLMDYLKNQVPLWKKVHFSTSTSWADAKASDKQALARWQTAEQNTAENCQATGKSRVSSVDV
ncbi:MAG: molybdenum cofactor biosynthesis protein MoaE [Rheinheimera sp.]|nr:MAG: molybdenum cofactor biosynthesis protein MoaE [Rheinheimera sp.]